MAELDGLRSYELVDEQVDYSPDIYLSVDDATFTSGTKKVKMGTIYPLIDVLDEATDINPATTELRVSISAGNEQRMTVNNLLSDSDVVVTMTTALGLDPIAWGTATKNYANLGVAAFMRCAVYGPWVVITGILSFSAIPAVDTLLFTLPGTFPLFTETHYIIAGDGNTGGVMEIKALVGTRTIVMGGGGYIAGEGFYTATILVI